MHPLEDPISYPVSLSLSGTSLKLRRSVGFMQLFSWTPPI